MRINIDDPDVDVDDSQRYLYRDEPFTGELYENDRNGNMVALFGVLRGVRNGVHREWFPDGTLKTEFNVVSGSAVGVSRDWHQNGVLAAEHEFDDRGDLVTRRRWADDGSPLSDAPQASVPDTRTSYVYYGVLTPGRSRENPAGVVRRSLVGGQPRDEVFTRSLQWRPTTALREQELGYSDREHVQITETEARAFVERIAAQQRD